MKGARVNGYQFVLAVARVALRQSLRLRRVRLSLSVTTLRRVRLSLSVTWSLLSDLTPSFLYSKRRHSVVETRSDT